MGRFANAVHRRHGDAPQAPAKSAKAPSSSGGGRLRRPARKLGNQAMQRLSSGLRNPAHRAGPTMAESAFTSTLRATVGDGEPLHEPVKTFMEISLGARLDRVRIHADHEAERMARMLGAEAFAVGRNIYFNAGRYAPRTAAGRALLAHELVHTVQQGFHDHVPADLRVAHSDDLAERQAHHVASRLVKGVFAGRPILAGHALQVARVQPCIQMAKGLEVAVYETKDHGTGYDDAPSESIKLEANSLAEAGTRLGALIKFARDMSPGASIGQLSFYGHGAPGSQSVGAGEAWDDTKEISTKSIGKFAEAYTKIYTPLGDGASVYLRGCNVGAGTEGLDLLKEVKTSCKTLAGKDIEAYGWTGKSYHRRILAYDSYEQTGQRVSSSDKEPKMTWEKLKERGATRK